MEKGTLILIVCVIFGLGLFMVSKLGCFIKESRKELSDERSNLQLLKKVEMSSKGRQKNADMHVIPGTVMPETGQKQKFKLHIETPSVKDYILTVSIFIGCTLIGLIFQKLYFTDANIVTIYILGVLLTSILTDGYLCSLAGSFLSVVLFCFFLTEPRMSFQTYAVGYPVTFLIMLISSVLTGTLAAKLKEHARLSAQQAFCTQILFDTNRLLQQVKDRRDILCVTCKQLVRLLNCNIVAYIEENGELSGGSLFFHNDERGRQGELLTSEEQYVARWAYENGQNAGATTNHFSSARCLYFVIKSGDNVYGVIGIPLPEEGTKAATMEHVPMEEAQRRTELLVDVQSVIIDEYNESVLGDVREVLCEGWSEEAQSFVGRSYAESVDIDGKIYFSAERDIMAGEFVNVRLTGTMDGELTGEAVE